MLLFLCLFSCAAGHVSAKKAFCWPWDLKALVLLVGWAVQSALCACHNHGDIEQLRIHKKLQQRPCSQRRINVDKGFGLDSREF